MLFFVCSVNLRFVRRMNSVMDVYLIIGGDVYVKESNSSNTISLWKIGEKVHELKLSKSFDGCSGEFVVASVKQWFDDKFIVRRMYIPLGSSVLYPVPVPLHTSRPDVSKSVAES